MERRHALKSMAGGLGALLALPAWANGWSKNELDRPQLLSTGELSGLEAVCDALLPKTDSYPGSKDLHVHLFVEKMIADCYDKKTGDRVKAGLAWLNKQSDSLFDKKFVDTSGKQRLNLLESMQVSNKKEFVDLFQLIKGLTVQGYTSSEYYMTHVMGYELVPGRFIGCKPYNPAD